MRLHASSSASRRVVAAVCAAAVALCGSGCALTTPSRAEVRPEAVEPQVSSSALVEDGVLTVALNTSSAPQAMLAQDGTVTGYAADVARELGEKLGLPVAFVDSASVSALADGEADIFLGAAPSASNDEVETVGSYLEDASALFCRTDKAEAVSAASLAGATVAVQGSSAAADALNSAGISVNQEVCTNVNECFEALAEGRVAYVACNAAAGAYLARAYAGVRIAGTLDAPSMLQVSVRASGPELAEAVAEAFDSVAADGTLDSVRTFWFGALPGSLSGTLVSGVELKPAQQEGDGSEAGQGASADTGGESDDAVEGAIDHDINSFQG